MKRILTAALLLPPVLYLILRAPSLAFLAAAAVVALLCFHEYRRIVEAHGFSCGGPIGYAAGLIVLLMPQREALAVLSILALVALLVAMRRENLSEALPSAGALLLGVVYVFLPWRFAAGLRAVSEHWVLFALAINWAGDVAAYYAGRAFGRHRMAPRVSPKKSWEGAAASVAASMLFGFLYLGRFQSGIPWYEVAGLCLVANLAGQWGDLAESAIKRGAGVKDSGVLLPGHGGFLDRLDSTLFSLPVVYFWVVQPWKF